MSNKLAVSEIAKKDISTYVKKLRADKFKVIDKKVDEVWFIGTTYLFTKEQAALNRELGISGINKIGNKNGSDRYMDKKFYNSWRKMFVNPLDLIAKISKSKEQYLANVIKHRESNPIYCKGVTEILKQELIDSLSSID